ncbi:S9 family peptidase [Aliikangiella marina]|uniref:S9 family peptidase n=1 Tax=Aliikangiella marina TaxID=1712262 RepID=A0A545TI87_9GAMM|nr:S9 family peptidase [Aliikangiella marina]TQV76918.1 S9 family peptidase [Aliikangiella marina]
MKISRVILGLLLTTNLLIHSGLVSANKKPFSAEDLVTFERVSSAVISPDGKHVSYVVRTTDMEANRGRTDVWLARLSDNQTTQLTSHNASDHSPKWSKTGRTVYFLSSRSGSSQVWKVNINNLKLTQVTDYPVDVTTFKLSPQNDKLLFSSRVYPDCEDFSCTVSRDAAEKTKKTSGMVYDKMFVRHWDHWVDQKQSQLFIAELNSKGIVKSKTIIPISKSVNANVPSDPFGGDEEYNFAGNGSAVYFSARIQNAQEPTSTNFDIYRVSIDKPQKAFNMTADNLAWDTQPVVSHDGQKLAYLAMKRPGFEADKFDVMIKNIRTGKLTNLTENFDRSFGSFHFSKDDNSLYLIGNNLGTRALWKFDIRSQKETLLNSDGFVSAVSVGDEKLVFIKDSLKSPSQIYTSDLNGKNIQQITINNQEKLNQIAFGDYEQFKFNGWNDETVYGYIVKPANFESDKKYPLAFLIHGGPQGSFGDHFHYRWNPQTYAGQGFVSVMIDFHGSTGYGQDFTDSISQNWGSKPLVDLQKGLKFALEKYDFIDENNMCALGASYGGYMINWIAGNWPEQFKCLVNHDGVFDNRMMYYATEELWFVEWENGGTYFDKPENHERYNPVNYVKNWKTPMLVIQGELDYRIPVTQSLATFTALQRKGIRSKLLYFPDENHWVLKPHNSIQWHHEVKKWLKEFLVE